MEHIDLIFCRRFQNIKEVALTISMNYAKLLFVNKVKVACQVISATRGYNVNALPE
jgi:hypothetical protein